MVSDLHYISVLLEFGQSMVKFWSKKRVKGHISLGCFDAFWVLWHSKHLTGVSLKQDTAVLIYRQHQLLISGWASFFPRILVDETPFQIPSNLMRWESRLNLSVLSSSTSHSQIHPIGCSFKFTNASESISAKLSDLMRGSFPTDWDSLEVWLMSN